MKRARLRFEGGRGISNLSYEVHRIVGLSDHPLADGLSHHVRRPWIYRGDYNCWSRVRWGCFSEFLRNRALAYLKVEERFQIAVRRNASSCLEARARLRLGSSAAGQERADLESASGLPVIHSIGSVSEQWRPGCCKSDESMTGKQKTDPKRSAN